MAAISSLGALRVLAPRDWWPGTTRQSISLYDNFTHDYATLYRTQPNVRVCVDFLARNIAQLGLHVFRRVGETDRERLRDYPLAQLLERPLPAEMKVSRYRLIESLVSDLGIYFNAYWLKIRRQGAVGALLRLPPPWVTVQGGLWPEQYKLNIVGRQLELAPADVVHFRGYSPESTLMGLSPLETLRRVLAEEHAAGQYREEFWARGARIEGFISRPKDAPEWSQAARERFLADFNQLYRGGGDEAGGTAVLEDGMTWQNGSFNPKDSEYIQGRRLTREECARAYHIPLPMVGILDHATFSNIKEQHKNLYQDCLGPQLAAIEADIQVQLLSDFPDADGVYVEFNIAEKLQGSFEEQMASLSSAIGRPFMTADEGRARLNLPAMGGDAEQLVVPLNVLIGGQASPQDSAPPPAPPPPKQAIPPPPKRYNATAPQLRARYREKWAQVMGRHYRRQEAVVMTRLPKALQTGARGKDVIGGIWHDTARWDAELTADLLRLNRATALEWAALTQRLARIDIDDMDAFEARMFPWLEEHSRIQAEGLNSQVVGELEAALGQPDVAGAVRHLFELAVSVWAIRAAVTGVTAAANFGSTEMARAGNLRFKTWRVNSGNPRPSHAAMDGMTIGIRDLFPTGQRWPGDPAGGADENANCECSVEFS